MELQFDKEMDAILRKARSTRGVLVGDDPPQPKKHLDADVIAAFAENAVPLKARLLYMEHFADCDSCRRTLSSTILMNTEAVAATASSVVSEPVAAVVPWYLRIFRTPNLALAMGALVLTFGGVLGYLVLQNRNDGANASVAKVSDQQPLHTYSGSEPAANTAVANSANASLANTAANMSAASNAPASNPVPSASGPSAAEAEPNLAGRADSPADSVTVSRERDLASGGAQPEAAKPAAAAPPPAAPQKTSSDERKIGEDKLKDDAAKEVMSKTETNDAYSRDGVMSAKKASGPNRAAISGPRNVQQQQMYSTTQNATGMIAPTRTAGGKTFTYKDGVWYDRSYNGQATNNFRRGTDEYKKLDGGLRKIADSLGGTVVVVWKSKAYRVQ